MSEWISVKDRLPEEGKNMLVFIPFRGESIFYVAYLESNTWYIPDRLGRYNLRGITHWMPLPEQPRVHEHWIPKKSMMYCSRCAEGFDVGYRLDFLYCPNCGAKMGEEKQNECSK